MRFSWTKYPSYNFFCPKDIENLIKKIELMKMWRLAKASTFCSFLRSHHKVWILDSKKVCHPNNTNQHCFIVTIISGRSENLKRGKWRGTNSEVGPKNFYLTSPWISPWICVIPLPSYMRTKSTTESTLPVKLDGKGFQHGPAVHQHSARSLQDSVNYSWLNTKVNTQC